jgi:hypothetical protein
MVAREAAEARRNDLERRLRGSQARLCSRLQELERELMGLTDVVRRLACGHPSMPVETRAVRAIEEIEARCADLDLAVLSAEATHIGDLKSSLAELDGVVDDRFRARALSVARR